MKEEASISPFRWVFFVLLGAGVLALCIISSKEPAEEEEEEEPFQSPPAGIYASDVQLSKIPQPLLECLILLSAEDLAQIPEVDGFEWPCGAPNAAMTYDAQAFGTYNEKREGHHSGMDINGIGGEDTDVGMPVCASARGLVVYSGVPGERWGNVVVVAHRLPGTNRVIQTLYAHLEERKVLQGEMVGRGQLVGTVGTAGGHYLGHLHFEAVESRCVEAGSVAYNKNGTMNRINPSQLLAEYPAPAIPDAYAAVRRIRILEANKAEAAETPSAPLPADTIPVTPSTLVTP